MCPCTSDPLRVTLSKKSVRLRNIDRQRKGGRYYIERVRENDWSRLLAFSRSEKPNSLGDSWIRSRRRIHEFFFAARKFMDSFLVYIYPYIYIYVYVYIYMHTYIYVRMYTRKGERVLNIKVPSHKFRWRLGVSSAPRDLSIR